jgi:hypothetical protein
MTAGSPTIPASDFPAANLPPSAQAWARAVAQRIAQLEAQNELQAATIADLNHLAVGSLHARRDALANYIGVFPVPS